MKYFPRDLATMMAAQLEMRSIEPVSLLAIDSRSIINPSESIFFALNGIRHDGHRFINELYTKGVRNFVVVNHFEIPQDCFAANYYFVKDVLYALQLLVSNHRKNFSIPVLAITGSNGKTIVKEWIWQMANEKETITRSPRSYNSQVGVPLSVWQINHKSDFAVLEAGISKKEEMLNLEKIIKPSLGLFTNIGAPHQQNFISLEEKLSEKLILFRDVDTIFYCKDHHLIDTKIKELYSDKQLITWGNNKDADLRIVSVEHNIQTIITTIWNKREYKWTLPFEDAASIENALFVLLFLLFKGYDAEYLQQKLKQLQPVEMRLEHKEGVGGALIINDTYSSDLTSLELALDFLNQQGQKKGIKRTIILSDMFQSGMSDAKLYEKVAQLLKNNHIDRLFGVGKVISSFTHLFDKNARFFKTTEELLSILHSFSFAKEAVLIKGARSFEFERIVSQLETKQHNTLLEINLNALINNLNIFRSRLNSDTKVLAMIKAFGYGSGSHEIASVLQHHKVDYLGVAFADEGTELRQAGISLPIIVMNPEENSFSTMLKLGLEPEIFSFKILNAFNKAVENEGVSNISIHIKIDTGMNRLGFRLEETEKLIAALKSMPNLRVKSVFSHLAGSSEPELDDFTQKQIARFKNVCEKIKSELQYNFLRHILNSSGIERFPDAHFDMVRIGIGLYGISAINDKRLENAVTLKTYISQIKRVAAGETVGYGCAQRFENKGVIAVIPIGYADGFNRKLSCGKGKVLVNGKLAPIVGNICMDMSMIDISSIINVKEGDEVIIFGNEYHLTEIAKQLDTIPYEILTSIGRRVKRVYFKE
ncbi:MAG: bifunctional UDP-N-acetylmuramoyl-tripeptide:D-alanyl-D-alanine ligase/alanine racemase [Marinilabiliaceae bacterium]|nr:bifunctional UDP-N-acetylmuramoyl-tripeptide:D-alanyl-D-alanine ligase/alanine racemase [Marinilabiliaceae bacterium]